MLFNTNSANAENNSKPSNQAPSVEFTDAQKQELAIGKLRLEMAYEKDETILPDLTDLSPEVQGFVTMIWNDINEAAAAAPTLELPSKDPVDMEINALFTWNKDYQRSERTINPETKKHAINVEIAPVLENLFLLRQNNNDDYLARWYANVQFSEKMAARRGNVKFVPAKNETRQPTLCISQECSNKSGYHNFNDYFKHIQATCIKAPLFISLKENGALAIHFDQKTTEKRRNNGLNRIFAYDSKKDIFQNRLDLIAALRKNHLIAEGVTSSNDSSSSSSDEPVAANTMQADSTSPRAVSPVLISVKTRLDLMNEAVKRYFNSLDEAAASLKRSHEDVENGNQRAEASTSSPVFYTDKGRERKVPRTEGEPVYPIYEEKSESSKGGSSNKMTGLS
jgi:hypothetical protein